MKFWEEIQLSSDGIKSLKTAMTVCTAHLAEPEHLLVAMFQQEHSVLVKYVLRLSPELELGLFCEALVVAVRPSIPKPTPAEWSDSLISERLQQLFNTLTADPRHPTAEADLRERLLASHLLSTIKPRIQRVLINSGLEIETLQERLTRTSTTSAAEPLFNSEGILNLNRFDRSAQKVLQLLETEGKGLGLKRIGTPLLLFGLATVKNSLLENALRLQAPKVDARRCRENLAMHLNSLGRGCLNPDLALSKPCLQEVVIQILERAAHEASENERELIVEADLLKSLLLARDDFTEAFLLGEQVDSKELSKLAHQRAVSGDFDEQQENELPTIAEVGAKLRQQVVGQDHVIDAVLPIIKRLRFGYTRKGRPAGVLLFLGMSGTGKTQLAKEIARAVYGSEEQLVFLEMGQFGSEYSKTMFIGAPPGLVGYGEGLLTNGLRDKPESVILFDEVEKAHKSVFDVLLRFLDEGQIADPAGPVRDGTKCIIILTSNHALDVLTPLIERQTAAGVQSPTDRANARAETRRAILQTEYFRPEFINRVDDILLFNTFTESAYVTIVENLVQSEIRRLHEEKELTVTVEQPVKDGIVAMCVERRDEGARVCGKLITDLIITPLIDFFVDEAHANVTSANVSLSSGGEIHISGRDAR